jgi:hypothetical protein
VLTLPTPTSIVSGLIIKSSSLTAIPNNLCAYPYLNTLDLSQNQINTAISATTFSCLTQLNTLNVSNNQISTLSNDAFNALNFLVTLDMSSNRIASIPTNLFASADVTNHKLPSLKYLYMQKNQITSLDPWFFYLPSITYINLSNNQISTFTNNLNFFITNGVIDPALKLLSTFDLSNNQISQFDDHVLGIYRVCDTFSMTFFIQLLYNMTLANNPLNCDCTKSYNMNKMTGQLVNAQALDTTTIIFKAKCVTGASVGNGSAIYFLSNIASSGCQPSSSSYYSCPYSVVTAAPVTAASVSTASPGQITTTGSPVTVVTGSTVSAALIAAPQNQYGDPAQAQLGVGPVSTSLYDGYIAGIILAFLFLLVLLFIILYMLCPIECYACCFGCCPCFYKICPCKSGHKRDKPYDLFISYNLANKTWVFKRLLPFIKGEYFFNVF